MKKFAHLLGIMGLSCLIAPTVTLAADYPTRNIEVIVPYSAGGGTDLVTRAFVDAANKYLPHNMGVVNKAGGGGAVGLTEIVMARPNGYKIGTGTVELTMLPNLGLVNWKASDVKPIARLNAEPSAISVKADSQWNSFQEFIDYAKHNPDKIRIGNSGTGAIWHIAAEALSDKTGAKFTHIPYGGANPAVTALLGGHIEAVTVSPAEVITHVQNNTIRILAIMADKRSEKFPDVPTLKELGVDLSIATWRGIVVPKKTPDDVVNKLSEVAFKVSQNDEFNQSLEKMNLTPAYLNSEEFEKVIEKDNAFFHDIMTKLGMTK
ncbi:Bug family tripartite tricarboxylate transporter substrate binding protein [Spirabiliibacterium falconis]|uniref:Bug family tripartite tricarboxylate transporter substrate binding protein n=1 Tax=Spirabiliibacterium falconis TaxID=572023 RepID=UPI001AAC4A6B|nr:tripartite tricarboxylate transporter substrate binding protein [Spirabiliibacterium falconis]MBE2893503.1 tripartite tricarboxylate transporter substrate binding protein [Spirabiliibacterium falconis]